MADQPPPGPPSHSEKAELESIISGTAQWWYLCGTGLVGVAAGLFAGMSASPVIGVMLPVLFGLLGGAGGFFVATIDLGKGTARGRIRLFGMALTTLMLTMLPSSLYGVLLRTGLGVASLLPRLAAAPAETTVAAVEIHPESDPVLSMELILLRQKLHMMGATIEEQRGVLDVARRRSADPTTKAALEQSLRRVAALAQQASELCTDELLAGAKGDSARAAEGIGRTVRGMAGEYLFYADTIARSNDVPLAVIQSRLQQDRDRLRENLHSSDGAAWLRNHEQLRISLWTLEMAMTEEAAKSGGTWMSGSRFADEFNKYALAALRGGDLSQPPTNSAVLRPAFAP